MRSSLSRFTLLALATTLETGSSFLARAQIAADTPLITNAAPAIPKTGAPGKPAWLIPDLELSKAKLSEVVEALRNATGIDIVVGVEVKDREVPYLNLQKVSAFGVLEAICQQDTGLVLLTQEDSGGLVYHIMPRTGEEPMPAPANALADDQTAAVDFPGGTLAELQLLLHSKLEANIVLPADAGKVKVPALRLRKVSALGALHAALIGAGADLEVTRLTDADGKVTTQILRVFNQPQHGTGGLGANARVVRVFSLHPPANLLRKEDELAATLEDPKRRANAEEADRARLAYAQAAEEFMEQTRRSVEAAVTLQRKTRGVGNAEMPDIQVHWATKIVIVSGREGDMNIVAEVMSAMGGAPVGENKSK
jgi:hypothetical protein